jgi:hypothetical protein
VAEPGMLTTDLRAALGEAEIALVCLPAFAHPAIFEWLAAAGASVPLVLNPGGVGGSLEAREVFRGRGVLLPPLAELLRRPQARSGDRGRQRRRRARMGRGAPRRG